MIPFPDVNWYAIIIASIFSVALGSFWYSPKLFGSIWMGAACCKEVEKKDVFKAFIGAFIGSLILTYILAVFIEWIGTDNAIQGAYIGFLSWLGFVATTLISPVLWEKQPLKIFGIHAGFKLVYLCLAGALLAWW